MVLSQVRKKLLGGEFADVFETLYGLGSHHHQTTRYLLALEEFQRYYGVGDERDISIYSSPGRTEIGGNHTDHQLGHVIAASVGLDIIAFVAKGEGNNAYNANNGIRIKSKGHKEDIIDISFLGMQESERGSSASLIRGVLAYFSSNGFKTGPFCAYTESDVPKGSGLSSSAAFESVVGAILSGEFNNWGVDPVEIAKAGQYAENEYFGKPCGLMDQLASSVGSVIRINFANPKNPEIRKIRLDLEQLNYSLCVVNTGGSHADLTDDYADIPSEMRGVATALNKKVLAEVDETDFIERIPSLRHKHSDRALIRAMHFYGENNRVKQQAELLESNDFSEFLHLVRESGHSSFCYLQNVFTTKAVEEQGISLALALTERFLGGVGACRVHGGGFAGTMLAFIPVERLEAYKAEVNYVFGENACTPLHLRQYGGYKLV